MDHRRLGQTDLRVSPIGLGTVKIGRNEQVKYPRPFDLPDDGQVMRLLETARDLGVNVIDTAPAYGSSEERLGRLLPGRREDWVIVTKAGEEFSDGRSTFDFTPEAIRRSVERSLRRLRTAVLDVVLIHSDGQDVEIIERSGSLEALHDLKATGTVRAVGISVKTVEGGLTAVRCCDVVMVTFNPKQTEERAVIRAANEAGVGVLVKKALLSGHLEALDSDVGDPVAACLQFALREPGASSVIVGTANPQHLRLAVASAVE